MTIDYRPGLYIHIPYCVRKCAYCDFCSFPIASGDGLEPYIDALIREAESYSGMIDRPFSTLFIGGGTPSLLSGDMMGRLLDRLSVIFPLSSDCEVTMESNPGTLCRDSLLAYRSAGINRLSIGLQSVNDNELRALGRIHSYRDFLSSYEWAGDAGIDNINVDLMYGIPEQTPDSFERSLRAVAKLRPNHISCYGLILEPGTPLYRMKDSLTLPDEDVECDMYEMACRLLPEYGYEHYEISNYARDRAYSAHNLKYWNDCEYIGLGLSAHSYFLGKRYSNSVDMANYLADPRPQYMREDVPLLSAEDEEFEYGMLNLRLRWGLSLTDFKRRFGHSFTDGRMDTLGKFQNMGLLQISDERVYFTERGMYLSNDLLSEIL